ncbi:MAG: hypothetical protein J7K66_05500 [Anaerolineaceae bacterium]|nr:hypothetical protein [Anaerolineaceae bacterium]
MKEIKAIKNIAGVLIILLVVVACDIGNVSVDLGSGGESSQQQASPIEAGVDSPVNGLSLPMGPIEIAYHATCTEGVSAIELSINGEVVNSFASPNSDQKVIALKYSWQPSVSGSHTIRVRAQSSTGAWSDFSNVTVNIEDSQQAPKQQATSSNPETPEDSNTPSATATQEGTTISNIKHSLDKFYFGSDACGSREITISADITHPDEIKVAVLFIRFYDLAGGEVTDWDSGHAMTHTSGDHFSITLKSNSIPNYNVYNSSAVNYQIVAQGKDGTNRARSKVVKSLMLELCP